MAEEVLSPVDLKVEEESQVSSVIASLFYAFVLSKNAIKES